LRRSIIIVAVVAAAWALLGFLSGLDDADSGFRCSRTVRVDGGFTLVCEPGSGSTEEEAAASDP
jgi:hypothetical protein